MLLCNGVHVYQTWGARAGEFIFISKMNSGTLLKATILLSLRVCAESSALHTRPGSQSIPAAGTEKCELLQSIHALCWGCRADYSQQGLTADHSRREHRFLSRLNCRFAPTPKSLLLPKKNIAKITSREHGISEIRPWEYQVSTNCQNREQDFLIFQLSNRLMNFCFLHFRLF